MFSLQLHYMSHIYEENSSSSPLISNIKWYHKITYFPALFRISNITYYTIRMNNKIRMSQQKIIEKCHKYHLLLNKSGTPTLVRTLVIFHVGDTKGTLVIPKERWWYKLERWWYHLECWWYPTLIIP